MEELDHYFKSFLNNETQAWGDFPEWDKITDKAIDEIIACSKIPFRNI